MHPLDGVLAKYDRAKEQFDEFLGEVDAWFNSDPEPHFSRGYFDTKNWEWVERFQIREHPPARLGVLLGDSIHNLRSALDHLIWQVTILDGATPDDATQFPIASKSKSQFDRMADRRIPGLRAKHRALVKRVQPYHAGNRAHAHPLSVLAALSNTDKHRIVNPTYSFIAGDSARELKRLVEGYRGSGHPPAVEFLLAKQGQGLVHGTPWLRIKFPKTQEPPRSVDVGGELTLGVAIGEVGVSADDIPKVADFVLAVISRFAQDFPEPWTRRREAATDADGH